ncbi:MAG: MBL fold metallo-hydrolase [Desulfobacter sp.]|nr:MAG: MBL fold metallo-hydrolase [Desulfobacter sp.]
MKLDGGSMFGNAPKALWAQWMPADDRNMIEIASKCLLVQTSKENILFETGAGAYLSPKMRQRFQIRESRHVLLESLADHGLDHREISHVILSHLHFDHAGGLLAKWEQGRDDLELLFPNAAYIVGEKNFFRACTPHSRDRASFIPGLAAMLEGSGRLSLKKEGDRLCLDPVEISFMESQGHTPGMLVSWIRAKDKTLVFTGDLIPAHPWVNLPITMGYDRFPEGLIDEKQQLLDRALKTNALLVYPHDPLCAASYLAKDPERQRVKPANPFSELSMVV